MSHQLDSVFQRRRYLHFDAPLARAKLEPQVTSAAAVARWRFLPFLLTDKDRSKVKHDPATHQLSVVPKSRSISASSHADAALYSYYAWMLTPLYEAQLQARGLVNVATAFRKLKKSNVHFALDAFVWIEEHRPCVVLTFDVQDFFGSLDHAYLKRRWSETVGASPLPADHFHVWRSLTRYSEVDKAKCFEVLGISKNNPRSRGRTRLCEASVFRKTISPLITTHPGSAGIPQGTPISALLSNIYMLEFDAAVLELIDSKGGLYRRYCDDILCVVPQEGEKVIEDAVQIWSDKLKLKLHPSKSSRHLFSGAVGSRIDGSPLQYLGLTFDGEFIRIRPGGIGRHYNRMRSAVRAATRARDKSARKMGKAAPEVRIRTRGLVKGFTHAGKQNFISYALSAARITKSAAIRKQIKRHSKELRENVRRKQNKPK